MQHADMTKKIPQAIAAATLPLCLLAAGTESRCQTHPHPDESTYFSLAAMADSLVAEADWQAAADTIRATLRAFPANPSNSMLFANLGVCLLNMEQYEDAIESLDIALVKAPDSPVVLTNRARASIALGREEEAMQNLQKAIAGDTTYADARRLRAFLCLNSGRAEEAYADFKSMLPATDTKESDPYMLAGAARAAAMIGRKEEASALYTKALDSSPDADTAVEAVAHFLATEPDETTQQLIIQQIKHHSQEGRLYLMMAALCKKRYLVTEMEANKKIARQYGIDSQTIENFLKNF